MIDAGCSSHRQTAPKSTTERYGRNQAKNPGDIKKEKNMRVHLNNSKVLADPGYKAVTNPNAPHYPYYFLNDIRIYFKEGFYIDGNPESLPNMFMDIAISFSLRGDVGGMGIESRSYHDARFPKACGEVRTVPGAKLHHEQILEVTGTDWLHVRSLWLSIVDQKPHKSTNEIIVEQIAQLNELQQDHKVLGHFFDIAMTQLDEMRKEAEKSRQKIEGCQAMIAQLEEENKSLRENVELSVTTLDHYTKSLSAAMEEGEGWERAYHNAKNKLAELRAELDKANTPWWKKLVDLRRNFLRVNHIPPYRQ